MIETFERLYDDTGDAEAYGLAKILCTYDFIATLYMLCDVLHTVAKLQGSLQSKALDLATVPVMVQSTISRLQEIKNDVSSTTWFKDHTTVFTDTNELGTRNIDFSRSHQDVFLSNVYRPYIQSVIDHIRRLNSCDLVSAFSVFDPSNLPDSEELSAYGIEKIKTLTSFYGQEQQIKLQGETGQSIPDIDTNETEAEWKIFQKIMMAKFKSGVDSESNIQTVMHRLLTSDTLYAGFPNLAKLAAIGLVIPVTTATVERAFSDMKLVKTRLRSCLGEDTLDYAMRVCIEGPDKLSDSELDAIVHHWKHQKNRRIVL